MTIHVVEQPDVPETTYKTCEVEGILDLYFYRRIGYWLAQTFVRLKITPAGVSLLGALCGVMAGRLYLFYNIGMNLSGVGLIFVSKSLHNTDTQFARFALDGQRTGRAIHS